jgi:hypothetical protein
MELNNLEGPCVEACHPHDVPDIFFLLAARGNLDLTDKEIPSRQ